jgi:hypothetical protein
MKSRIVKVQVEGGLGNHLFQYAAGKYLAEKTGSRLVIDTSRIGHGMTNHGYYLNLLFRDFDEVTLSSENCRFFELLKFKERVISYLLRRNIYARDLVYKIFKIYFSDEIGFDERLLRLNKPVAIRGYFQTWKFAEQLKASNKLIPEISNTSEWFKEMKTLAGEVKPVIVHIRRGDYRLMAADFGLLSKSYYVKAINSLPSHLKEREIWVFSNEIDFAKEMFQFETTYDFRFISPPDDLNPAESLLLMSYGFAHIIANSTFSYWGSYLSENSEITIAPAKWFKALGDPKDLYDPKWILEESIWEDEKSF